MESVPSLAPANLSRRQRQVVALLSWGRSVREIAEMTRLSPKTVENVRCIAYAKLGTHSRVLVTRWAMRHRVDVMTPATLSATQRKQPTVRLSVLRTRPSDPRSAVASGSVSTPPSPLQGRTSNPHSGQTPLSLPVKS